MPDRTIFRPSAREAYRRSTEQALRPQPISWPGAAAGGFLLAVLVGALTAAWAVRVPTYVSAAGVIGAGDRGAATTRAVTLLLPSGEADRLRPGQPVQVRAGATGAALAGTV